MKAERRHELKRNSLTQGLGSIPETLKQYQSQIALVVVLIALAIVLVQYRWSSAEQRLADAKTSLAIASDDLQRLENMAPQPGTDMSIVMKQREELYSEGLQQADEALQKAPSSQTVLKARALVLKGDLNFNMANFPELPGAATQPTLRPEESDETLLSNAADAYNEVLQNYVGEKFAVTAAHFGLAAVAENRGEWDAAKAQYQAVLDGDAETGYKDIATMRVGMLAQLRQKVAVDLPANTTTIVTTQASSRPGK
jgi:tetratricopeptide (TPR) repeat protein